MHRSTTGMVAALGLLRLGLAAWLTARPRSAAAALGAWPRDRRDQALVRLLAAREVVLGAGTLRAAVRGRGAGAWVGAQGLTDAADTALYLAGERLGHLEPAAARRAAALAASGAVGAALGVLWLRRDPRRPV